MLQAPSLSPTRLPERRKPRRRPNPFTFHIGRCARTRRPGGVSSPPPCGPQTRIGFAPETIAPPPRSAAHLFSRGERMTAYLISLALLGLIAIVVAEILS